MGRNDVDYAHFAGLRHRLYMAGCSLDEWVNERYGFDPPWPFHAVLIGRFATWTARRGGCRWMGTHRQMKKLPDHVERCPECRAERGLR